MCIAQLVPGILAQRWQIMRKTIIGNPDNIEKMIAATTVLHNFLMTTNDKTYLPPGAADTIYGDGEAAAGKWRAHDINLPQAPAKAARNYPAQAAAARQQFLEHLNNEGAVVWQYDHINRRVRRL